MHVRNWYAPWPYLIHTLCLPLCCLLLTCCLITRLEEVCNPKLLVHLEGRLGRLYRPVHIQAWNNKLTPMQAMRGPCNLVIECAHGTPRGGEKRARYTVIEVPYNNRLFLHLWRASSFPLVSNTQQVLYSLPWLLSGKDPPTRVMLESRAAYAKVATMGGGWQQWIGGQEWFQCTQIKREEADVQVSIVLAGWAKNGLKVGETYKLHTCMCGMHSAHDFRCEFKCECERRIHEPVL